MKTLADSCEEVRMKWRFLVLIILWSIAQYSSGQTSDQRDFEGKLLALERVGKFQATELKDVKMMNEILDDNFVSVDADGRLMDKSQLLNFVRNATSLRYRASGLTIRSHGKTAIVTGVSVLTGLVGGEPFNHRARFVGTWVPKDGRWRMIASISTPLN